MKRVIIVHCWDGVPNSRWYPYVKKELEKDGAFKVEIPAMPNTARPEPRAWQEKLAEVIGTADENLYLVGHSVGVPAIFRYIERLPEGIRIGGVVSVAGYTDALEDVAAIGDKTVLPPFFDPPFDWEKIKRSAKKFVVIYSNNDPYVSPKYAEIIKDELDAELILKKGMGHFSEPDGEGDSVIVKELPDVVEAIKKMAKA